LAGPPVGLYTDESDCRTDRRSGWPKYKAWAADRQRMRDAGETPPPLDQAGPEAWPQYKDHLRNPIDLGPSEPIGTALAGPPPDLYQDWREEEADRKAGFPILKAHFAGERQAAPPAGDENGSADP
jgi:hypothetical protein